MGVTTVPLDASLEAAMDQMIKIGIGYLFVNSFT